MQQLLASPAPAPRWVPAGGRGGRRAQALTGVVVILCGPQWAHHVHLRMPGEHAGRPEPPSWVPAAGSRWYHTGRAPPPLSGAPKWRCPLPRGNKRVRRWARQSPPRRRPACTAGDGRCCWLWASNIHPRRRAPRRLAPSLGGPRSCRRSCRPCRSAGPLHSRCFCSHGGGLQGGCDAGWGAL